MTEETRISAGGMKKSSTKSGAGRFKFAADGSERGGRRAGDSAQRARDGRQKQGSGGFGAEEWSAAADTAVGDPRPPAMRVLAGQLRLRLAVAHEMVRDATGVVGAVMAGAGVRAGGAAATTSSDRELASETMRLRAMEAVLSQPRGAPLSLSEQVVALYAVSHPELARLMGVKTGDAAGRGHDPLDALRGGRDSPLLEHFRAQSDTAALMHEIDSDLQLGTARTKRLELLLRVFFQLWSAGAITAQSKKKK